MGGCSLALLPQPPPARPGQALPQERLQVGTVQHRSASTAGVLVNQGRNVALVPAPLQPVTLRAQKGSPLQRAVVGRHIKPLRQRQPRHSDPPLTPKKTRAQNTTKPSSNHPSRKPY